MLEGLGLEDGGHPPFKIASVPVCAVNLEL